VQAALTGLGLLQAHHYIVAHALAEGRLVEILAQHAPPALPMGVLCRSGGARSAKIRAFVEAMVALFAGLGRPSA
jgi:DNA-binding transcriptional LysR family regulator